MQQDSSNKQIVTLGELTHEELRFLLALRTPELRKKIIAILEEP